MASELGKDDMDGSEPAHQPENCGEHVADLIAGALRYPCALPKGHEGGHRAAGNCFKHGPYLGEVEAPPQCPKWPECVEPARQPENKLCSVCKQLPPYHEDWCDLEQQNEIARLQAELEKLRQELAQAKSDAVDVDMDLAATKERMQAEIDKLREALRGLRREIGAWLELAYPMLVQELSITNVRCMEHQIEKAEAALSGKDSTPAK